MFSSFAQTKSFNLALSQTTNLDSSKLNEFADDNFKFDENDKKFSERVENTMGKGEIAPNKQFLLFSQCFQKTYSADTYICKTRPLIRLTLAVLSLFTNITGVAVLLLNIRQSVSRTVSLKNSMKTLWEKEKMLKTTVFSTISENTNSFVPI